MKRFLPAAAVVGVGLPAHATNIFDTVIGTASLSESISWANGGPTISPTSKSVSASVEFSPITTFSSAYSFTLAPHATCSGLGCVGRSNSGTETDTITVTFTGFQVAGHAVPTFTETGTFTPSPPSMPGPSCRARWAMGCHRTPVPLTASSGLAR
jgi:hypothetical protein